MNALELLIILGGAWGVLALVGILCDAIERRRAKHAEEKAARDRDEAYYQRSLAMASQVSSSWPPPKENVVPFVQRRLM